MAHLLCLTSGLTGILHASFEVVHQLEQAGHTVKIATVNNVREKVEVQGFEYVQLPLFKPDLAPETPTYSGPLKSLIRMIHRVTKYSSRLKQAIQNLEMDQYRALLKTEQADLVLIDIELHAYIFTSYQENIPFLLLSQWFTGIKLPGLPPLDSDYIPNQDSASNTALDQIWEQREGQIKKDYLKSKLLSFYTDRRSVLLAYAKQIGFPIRLLRHYNWPVPFTYTELPILHLNLLELEFPHQAPENHHYIGQMVYEKRKELALGVKEQERLERILAKKKDQQLIYLTSSTMNAGDTRFIQQFIEAIANQPDWLAVVSLGGQTAFNFNNKLPENVFLFEYIPQLLILQHADCCVNHGGIHTINECIYFNVPMAIYSGDRHDQNGCTARMNYHKLAMVGNRGMDDANQIRATIEKALNDPVYQDNIREMNQLNQSEAYQRKLCTLIDRKLKS